MHEEHLFIAELLEKYPDLNLEEQEQLNSWLEQGDNKQKFDRIIDKESLKEDLRQLDQLKIESGHSWEKLLQLKQGQTKIFWLKNWRTYAAAASIALILGLGGVIWLQSSKRDAGVAQKETVPVQNVSDVAPGQYKAKLTLSDGTTIILDTAKDGTLVQQEGANIVNKDGKLVYEKGRETNKVLYNTLSTSKAQTYATVLSDGTKVWLNSESSIHYPVRFISDVRKVEITGEAYFEVAPSIGKNGKRPFVVSANGMEIEVLGTHFNINSYSDEPAMKTTLLEGKVKVRSSTTNEQTILAPGEQAILRQAQDDKAKLDKIKDVDVDAEVSWRFGYFNFNNADLKTMMRQLERWYDVEVQYEGTVPDIKFLGEVPREMTLSQVLNVLEKQGVHFKMVGKKIIVTP